MGVDERSESAILDDECFVYLKASLLCLLGEGNESALLTSQYT